MRSRAHLLVVAGVLASLTAGGSLFAAPLTWDPGATNNASPGGTGTWNTSSWWNGAADVGWITGSDAILGGTPGTVTLSAAISANSLTLSAAGYTISGNPLTVASGGITASAAGTTTVSANVVLNTAPLFTVASGGTLALNGDLTRPAGTVLRFLNAGTITLNTVNGTPVSTVVANNNGILGGWATSGEQFATYGGGNVSAYTQEYSISATNLLSSALPTSNVLAASTTSAQQTITSNLTINSLIAQHDVLVNNGATLTLASGGIIMSGQSFWLQSSGTGYVTSSFSNGSGGDDLTVTVNNSSYTDMRFNNNFVVTDNGATPVTLIKAGSGLLTMTSPAGNLNTGGLDVSGGSLKIGDGTVGHEVVGALGSGPVTISNGALLWFQAGGTNNVYNFPNSFVFNGGTLRGEDGFQHIGTAGTSTMNIGPSGGTVQVTWNNKDVYLDGQLTGSGPLLLAHNPATGNGTSHIQITNNTNTFSGSVGISSASNAVQLLLDVPNGLQFATVNTNPGTSSTMQLNGSANTTYTIAGLTGSAGSVRPNTAAGTYTLAVKSVANTTFGGTLVNNTGILALRTSGSGVLTLNGANTYSGGTTVNSGTLAVGPTGSLGTGSVTVSSGADLFVANGGNLGTGNKTIVPGGVLDVSSFPSGYNLTSGVLTAGRTSSFATDINGSLNVTNATLTPSTSNSTMTISGSLAMSGGSLNYSPGDIFAVPSGALTLGGTDYILPQLFLSAGTYSLFTYNSGISTPVASNLQMAGPNSSGRQTYSFGAAGGTVNVVVSGSAANLYWRGGNWDNAISTSWFNASSGSLDKFFTGDAVNFDDSAGVSNGTVTINGVVQPGTGGINVNNTAVGYVFSGTGTIVGGGPLAMNGPGSLTISTSNTYSGGTNLNGGLLVLNNNGAIGSGPLTIAGGTLDDIAAGGGTLASNNAQSWNADFAFNGTQNLNMGTGAVLLGSSRTVTVNNGTLTVLGVISDSGSAYSLRKAGSGNLTLGAVNTYTGGTIVNGGTLTLTAGGQSGTLQGSLTINPGATVFLPVSNALGYGGSNWVQNITINGGFLTSGTVSDNGWGTNITMTAGTMNSTVAGGYFAMGTASTASSPTFNIMPSAAPSVISANLNDRNDNANPGIIFNVTRGSAASDLIVTGNILNANGGTPGIIVNGNGITVLAGANTYPGLTTINGGTLQLGDGTSGHDGTINTTTGVTNNAMLAYNLFNNQAAAYVISGSGNLTKLGPGQLTLNGVNSYSGTTTVGGGVLNINGGDSSAAFIVNGGALYVNTSSPATSVSVAGGATFGGIPSLSSASANVADGGILDFSPVTSTTVSLNALTYAGSSTLKLGPVANFAFSPILNAGALTTAGQININANQGAVSVLAGTYDLVSYNSIAGTGTSVFNLASVGGLSSRQTASLLNFSGQLDLVIAGQTPYWNGNQPDWLAANAWTLQPNGNLTTFVTGDADVFDDTAGTGAYAGTVQLNSGNVAPLSVTFNNAGLAYTVSGNFGITGSGALAVERGGSVTLLNSNSYTGGTTVNSGILQLGNGGATGSLSPSSSITLGVNGQLVFSRSNSVVQGVDFSGSPINGAGSVMQNGPGALILNTSNGYTGTTTINGGTLQLGTGASGQDGSIANTSGVNDFGTLAYNLFGSQTVAYQISGAGNLEKAGPGALTLTTSNSYTGGTVVDGGTLNLSFGNGGTGTLRDGLTINPGATVVCTVSNALGYIGLNWVQNITINGGALLTSIAGNDNGWDTAITMTGGTLGSTVAGGYFAMGTPSSATPPSFNILASNAPAVISANLNDRGDTGNTGITFNVTRGSAAADLLVSGNILTANGGTAGITLNGNGITIFTGTNTYPGSTTIFGGLLQLGDGAGHDGSINTTTAVFNNGELVYAIAGSQTAAYPISGNGSLFMTGTGTVVLSASNGYTGSTTVNAGKLYANGPLSSVVTVNSGLFGGRGSSPGASVATGGSIEGGFNGTGTLKLGLLSYSGSGTFTTKGYANYPAFASAAPLDVTGSNGLTLGGNPVVINLGGPAAGFAGTYHLIQYSGMIGGGGFAAFTLGATGANTPRGQVTGFTLVNDPGYVDVSVSVTPVIWTGSLSTAWNANDTLPAPMNWTYSGSGTNFQAGDLVQFDNSTVSGGAVDISNGVVLPGGTTFNNDGAHPYTMTGLNGIGGTGLLVKNGPGSLTIDNSNGYSGGTIFAGGQLVLNNNTALGTGLLTISGGTLDSTVSGVSLTNNVQNWNGDFTFNGTQNLNMGSGAVTLGSSRTVTVNANTLTIGGAISDGGNAYSLNKTGPGNLTLGTANTYTGATIVNGGTLQLNYAGNNSTGALASPTITVNAGSVLALNAPDVIGYTVGREALSINDGTVANITAAGRVTFQNKVTMTGGTMSGAGAGAARGVYSIDAQNGADGIDAISDATGNPAVINATSFSLQTVGGVILNVTRGPANPRFDMVITSNIIDFGTNSLTQNGNGILVLTASGAIPVSGSSFTGNIVVNGGTLVAAAEASGNQTVLGNASNARSITVNSGAVLDIIAPNATAAVFSATNVPTLNISGGTVTNGEPGAPIPAGQVNNALNNVSLTNGLLTATTGQHGGYAAWNVNGTVTSSGTSTISTSDPVYGTVMLSSTAAAGSVGVTAFNVSDGVLTVSAPLVQDNVDGLTSGLLKTGPGTMVLSGSDDYMGGTTVDDGTLVIANPQSLYQGTSLFVGDPTLVTLPLALVIPPTVVSSSAVAPVPEPTTLGILGAFLAGAAVYRRLRRK